jgi:hypothetical protein
VWTSQNSQISPLWALRAGGKRRPPRITPTASAIRKHPPTPYSGENSQYRHLGKEDANQNSEANSPSDASVLQRFEYRLRLRLHGGKPPYPKTTASKERKKPGTARRGRCRKRNIKPVKLKAGHGPAIHASTVFYVPLLPKPQGHLTTRGVCGCLAVVVIV